jgi:ComF family protein
LADYEGVIRECIHALKYEKRLGFGWFFSKPLSEIVIKEGWQPDLISPVPLSQERMRERGYNQAAQIAKPLAACLGVQYNPYGLVRIRDTKSQVGLSAGERRINVAGAFEAKTELVFGKKVLIIDDVMTTGATLGACADALRLAGSNEVYCLVLAGFIKRVNANNLNIHQV